MSQSRLGVWLLALLAHVLVTTVGGGLVLCFEADGRVVIEKAAGDRCGDLPASPSGPTTTKTAAGDCESCVDVPLSHTEAASQPVPSRIVAAGIDLAAPVLRAVLSSSPIEAARALTARTIDRTADGPTAFLRSVVILC
jgi:hypothetical protein